MHEIRALTSFRGVAAFYITLLHFSTAVEKHCQVVIPALAPRGHLAVDFFFVLSGFIMGYTYLAEFKTEGYLRAMPSFMLKRIARIYPLHWFVTLLLLAYTLAVAPDFAGGPAPALTSTRPVYDVTINLLLLQGLSWAPNMNGPSWSISVEMFAYLAFPVFLLLLFNDRAWIRLAGLAAAVLALLLTALQRGQLSLDTMEIGVGWTFLRGFAEFALGLAAYRAFAQRTQAALIGSDIVLALLMLFAAAMMVLRLWDLAAVLAFPLIILGTAHNRGLVARLLELRPVYFMGVISFSLYLVHYPLAYLELQALRYFHPALVDKPTALILAALGACSTILPAWLTYRLVERPGRSVVRALAERLRPESRRPAVAR